MTGVRAKALTLTNPSNIVIPQWQIPVGSLMDYRMIGYHNMTRGLLDPHASASIGTNASVHIMHIDWDSYPTAWITCLPAQPWDFCGSWPRRRLFPKTAISTLKAPTLTTENAGFLLDKPAIAVGLPPYAHAVPVDTNRPFLFMLKLCFHVCFSLFRFLSHKATFSRLVCLSLALSHMCVIWEKYANKEDIYRFIYITHIIIYINLLLQLFLSVFLGNVTGKWTGKRCVLCSFHRLCPTHTYIYIYILVVG